MLSRLSKCWASILPTWLWRLISAGTSTTVRLSASGRSPIGAAGSCLTAPPAGDALTGRAKMLAAMAMAVATVATVTGPRAAPHFVWNVSGSAPIGLYRVRPVAHLVVTTLVVAYPPEPLATWLDEGRYLPRGVPLLKPVLALNGQIVCRVGRVITVDGRDMGVARERDRRGRLLPGWQGCRVIGDGEVFLMKRDEPASLDGRYFGPIPVSAIIGRADPLWTSAENR